jgi:type IV pilus assembly protein PilB
MNGARVTMSACHDRRLIGDILLEREVITRSQLDEALSAQQSGDPGMYLGAVLLRLGYVSEVDMVTALVLQCNLPYIAVNKHKITPDILGLIPSQMAHAQRMIPFDRIGNILSVVMEDPLDDAARARVEKQTGCRIAIFISTGSEIDQALARLYPQES